jgi:hypothetical protein
MAADLSAVVKAEALQGEDARETQQLEIMLGRAREYVESSCWCSRILDAYFGFGIGEVVALFLFEVEIQTGAREWLWVVEGDLPSAYLVTDHAPNPRAALQVYCELMEEWAAAVQNRLPLDQVFPVKAPADAAHAAMLRKRIALLREQVLPAMTP